MGTANINFLYDLNIYSKLLASTFIIAFNRELQGRLHLHKPERTRRTRCDVAPWCGSRRCSRLTCWGKQSCELQGWRGVRRCAGLRSRNNACPRPRTIQTQSTKKRKQKYEHRRIGKVRCKTPRTKHTDGCMHCDTPRNFRCPDS